MDGIYDYRELKIEIYESGESCFLVILNDQYPNEPIVINGNRAKKIIHDLMAEITK